MSELGYTPNRGVSRAAKLPPLMGEKFLRFSSRRCNINIDTQFFNILNSQDQFSGLLSSTF
jgi:hypothetical protein